MKKYCKILLLLLVLLCVACKKDEEVKIEPFDLKEEYYKERYNPQQL